MCGRTALLLLPFLPTTSLRQQGIWPTKENSNTTHGRVKRLRAICCTSAWSHAKKSSHSVLGKLFLSCGFLALKPDRDGSCPLTCLPPIGIPTPAYPSGKKQRKWNKLNGWQDCLREEEVGWGPVDSDGSQNISSEAFVPVTNADGHQTWPSNLGEPLPFISYQEKYLGWQWPEKKKHPKEKKNGIEDNRVGRPLPHSVLGEGRSHCFIGDWTIPLL